MKSLIKYVIPTKVGIQKFLNSLDSGFRRNDKAKIVICILIFAFCARAQDKAFDEAKARAIADQLRCPVCRGIPIAESPSELAQNMMKQIREQLSEGKSEEEILNYFVERYGEWILLKPKPKGMNLMIWVFPVILLAGGILVLVFSLKKWTRP